MRFRELTLRPVAGSLTAGGEARVFRLAAGGAVAVLRSSLDHEAFDDVVDKLISDGIAGTIVALRPGDEFTLCEVEDGAPARWQEDGRPSYQDLERRVKELESGLAMSVSADSMPCTVRP